MAVRNLSPEEIAKKQVRRAQAAVQDYKDGVRNTQKKPMELAKAAIPKMVAAFNEAAENGTIAAGFDSVSDADWKDMTEKKGGANYSGGVAAALPKIEEFQRQFRPALQAASRVVEAMPSSTFEERLARMDTMARELHKFRFRRRRVTI